MRIEFGVDRRDVRRRRREAARAQTRTPEGLRLITSVDEVTYPWGAVPAPVWEPNWMAVPLRFGEVAVPRDALGPGGREGVERAGPVAVWIDGGAVVERGDGWEHRVAREIVTTARRVGPLVVLEGGGTGCVLEARALERSPALRALVAEVEPSG